MQNHVWFESIAVFHGIPDCTSKLLLYIVAVKRMARTGWRGGTSRSTSGIPGSLEAHGPRHAFDCAGDQGVLCMIYCLVPPCPLSLIFVSPISYPLPTPLLQLRLPLTRPRGLRALPTTSTLPRQSLHPSPHTTKSRPRKPAAIRRNHNPQPPRPIPKRAGKRHSAPAPVQHIPQKLCQPLRIQILTRALQIALFRC
jgi:hypothetical protein